MRLILTCLRLLALVAMALCTALCVDYFSRVPIVCSVGADCDDVYAGLNPLMGLFLPSIGLIVFCFIFSITLVAHRPFVAQILGPIAILTGVGGIALVSIQLFWMGRMCPICLFVDACAIGLGALGFALPVPSSQSLSLSSPSVLGRWICVTMAILAVAAPIGWMMWRPVPLAPKLVVDHWLEGRVNIIEVTDFACSHCRQVHKELSQFLQKYPENIHFVRLVVPLGRKAGSVDAAKAALYAATQGKGEEMADALFAADHLSRACKVFCVTLAGNAICITWASGPRR